MAQSIAWPPQAPQPPAPRLVSSRPDDAPRSLSRRLWNFDWQDVLPWRFEDGRAEAATADAALPFVREHYPSIFGHADLAGRFISTPMTDAKRRFFAEMDYIVFRVGADLAGVFMGHPTDWTTYYLRSAALLPEHRERRILTHFLERIDGPLRAVGVERIDAECSPANVPVVRLLTGQGYVATGSTSSERWGLMLRYTKFLTDEARTAFVRQYTAMPISRRRRDADPAGKTTHKP